MAARFQAFEARQAIGIGARARELIAARVQDAHVRVRSALHKLGFRFRLHVGGRWSDKTIQQTVAGKTRADVQLQSYDSTP